MSKIKLAYTGVYANIIDVVLKGADNSLSTFKYTNIPIFIISFISIVVVESESIVQLKYWCYIIILKLENLVSRNR